ncbi:MAG: molybdate ABC transporter substrate-binding protein [Candidatus Dormibacteraeota bacterium]|nr:molybdate ABC transporter substrate-binding protein [Candidatus Dormibacteraeota bacterium]
MRLRHRGRWATAALGAGSVLAGCGSAASQSPAAATPARRLSGPVIVFAAASLTEALADDKRQLVSANPGLLITYSFAGSQQLVAQIQSGAPADVVATADQASMQTLVAGNLVETPRVFARNLLEIAVAPGNPKGVKALSDLARSNLRVVLEDPSVPAGKYGRQALDKQGVHVSPVSLELDVKSELQKVESGEADAGIVYATDVRSAGARATGVAIPPGQNVVATYPVAVVKAAGNHPLAQAFVDQLVSGTGQDALRARGFLAP